MAQVTIAGLDDLVQAFKLSAAGAGFPVVDVSSTIIQIDFSGDPNYINLDNTILVQFQVSSNRMQYRACLQPKTTLTYTSAKSLTSYVYFGGGSHSNEWCDMGAVGDIISYSTLGNFMAVMPNKVTQYQRDPFFAWKSVSPYDGVIRYYVSLCGTFYSSNLYYNTYIGQMSPAVQLCSTTGSAYRTIVGDGLTTPCVIWQTVNSMAIDYMPNWVGWRSDLSLYANNFTIDGKTYHYLGNWMMTQSTSLTGGFALAVRLDA